MPSPSEEGSSPTAGADIILSEVGDTKVRPSFVQRAGLWLAGCVGLLIAAVTVLSVIFLYLHYPAAPDWNALGGNEAAAQAVLARHKQLAEIAREDTLRIFQGIVLQGLLPVFTAILGYLFAKGGNGEGGD